MIEYWLQKKTLGGWSQVTSYTELEQARRNYTSCVGNGLSGYCWRLVECNVIEQAMLEEVVDIPPAAMDAILYGQSFVKDGNQPIPAEKVVIKTGAWGQPVQDKKSGWTTLSMDWDSNRTSNNPEPMGSATPVNFVDKPDHGMIGKVWLVCHKLKQRMRADPNDVDRLIATGVWEKGGPKTPFREE